ncbi:kinase-like domain-containing protein [Aspergillus karnatakaensis]|uniref:kinase-like domain-containing protein n=1 Tax=Aspergillus karnatakaensis TaxID=1810916 RepID=UPI003CCD0321
MATITELVEDSRLIARFYNDYVGHEVSDTSNPTRQRKKEERWRRERRLGRGAYGDVWLERCASTNGNGIGNGNATEQKLRAVKEISKKETEYQRELYALVKFSQPKYDGMFVKFFGWYESSRSIFMAMEFFELGDLERHLKERALAEGEAKQVVSQILDGLGHLHANGFAHRDLKPGNILVVQKHPDWWVKIGDFGISKRAMDGDTVLHTIAGTPGFVAPEIIAQQNYFANDRTEAAYTHMVDIWSLGVVTHYILTQSMPFQRQLDLNAWTRDGRYPAEALISRGLQGEVHDFIKALVAADPKRRLPVRKALEHSWIKSMAGPSSIVQYPEHFTTIRPGQYASHSSYTSEASKAWSDLVSSPHKPAKVVTLPQEACHRGYAVSDVRNSIPNDKGVTYRPELGRQEPLGSLNSVTSSHKLAKAEHLPQVTAQVGDVKLASGKTQRNTATTASSPESQKMRGHELFEREEFALAAKAFEQLYQTQMRTLGPTHEDTLTSAFWVAKSCSQEERLEDAITWFEKVYQGRTATSGRASREAADAAFLLGAAYDKQKALKKSLAWYQTAYEGYKETIGPVHRLTLSTSDRVAQLLFSHQTFQTAADWFRILYEGQCKTLGPMHGETLDTAANAAHSFYKAKLYDQAESWFLKVFEARLKTLGYTSKKTVDAASQRAEVYYAQGWFDDAASVQSHVYGLYANNGAELHPHALAAAYSAGRYLHAGKIYVRAVTFLRTAYDGYIAAPELAGLMKFECARLLAESHLAESEGGEAEEILSAVLSKSQQALDPGHPLNWQLGYLKFQCEFDRGEYGGAIATLRNLETLKSENEPRDDQVRKLKAGLSYYYGLVDLAKGNVRGARELFKQAMEAQEKVLEPLDPALLRTKHNYGVCLFRQIKWWDAEPVFRAAAEGRSTALGPHDKDTLSSMHYFGVNLYKQRKVAESATILESIIDTQESVLGPLHQETVTSLHYLGKCLLKRSQHKTAEARLRLAYERRVKLLGFEHQDTKETRTALHGAQKHLRLPLTA